jgi:hypothetical protein
MQGSAVQELDHPLVAAGASCQGVAKLNAASVQMLPGPPPPKEPAGRCTRGTVQGGVSCPVA